MTERKNPFLDPKLVQDPDATLKKFAAFVSKDLPRLDGEAKKTRLRLESFRAEAGHKNVLKNDGKGIKPEEFLGEPFLLLEAHEGDDGSRPLAPPPRRCRALEVLVNGQPVDRARPGQDHEVVVRATNAGDLEAPTVYVELFHGGRELHPSAQPFRLTVEDVFKIAGRGTVVTGTVASGSVQAGADLVIRGSGGEIRTQAAAFQPSAPAASAGQKVGILLRGVRREDVTRGDLVLRADQLDAPAALPRVPAVEYLGTQVVRLEPFATEEARFNWRPPAVTDSHLPSMFFARLYSLAPVQLPEDFDSLDCGRSRFVGQFALG